MKNNTERQNEMDRINKHVIKSTVCDALRFKCMKVKWYIRGGLRLAVHY